VNRSVKKHSKSFKFDGQAVLHIGLESEYIGGAWRRSNSGSLYLSDSGNVLWDAARGDLTKVLLTSAPPRAAIECMIKHFNDKYNPHKDVCCLSEKLLIPYPQLMLDIFDNILIVLPPLLSSRVFFMPILG
jgi:hypothetical protein